MAIDARVSEILAEVRVLELAALNRDGVPHVWPMSGSWVPESGHIIITTPPAYPQKVFNIRRDGRVSLFYSDFTGSDLPGTHAVLVQGIASAPATVAGPHDIPDYWRTLFRRTPSLVDDLAPPEHRGAMDWYYWRLPIFVTPKRVHVFDATASGGRLEPHPPEDAPMAAQINDALERYPTAVFAGLDETGHPYSVRAEVAQSGDDLLVHPAQPFQGTAGPASLLWHRHNGSSGDMTSLLVLGSATNTGSSWRFTPDRLPSALTGGHDISSYEEWIADGKRRTARYLDKHGITAPKIDWDQLVGYGPAN
jgi:hypothetical protein